MKSKPSKIQAIKNNERQLTLATPTVRFLIEGRKQTPKRQRVALAQMLGEAGTAI